VAGTQERPFVVADFINQTMSSPLIAAPCCVAAAAAADVGMATNSLIGDDVTNSTQRHFVQFYYFY